MSAPSTLEPQTTENISPEPTRITPPLEPPPKQGRSGSLVAALILIGLGTMFLIANLGGPQLGGAMILLGIAAAFLVARLVTGHYGFAVPAGILAGLGSFVALEETGTIPGGDGWPLIMLGLGFVAVYLLGFRFELIWPLFPAGILVGLGLMIGGMIDVSALAAYAWIAPYWPLVLIVIGGWLLLRDQLPMAVRQPVAVIGTIALIIYGILAVGSSIAAPMAGVTMPQPRINVPGFSGQRATETITLNAPLTETGTLRVVNSSGRTVVRQGGADVRVTATVSSPTGSSASQVRLTPEGNDLVLNLANTAWLTGVSVDYLIEAPAGAGVTVQSASGDVMVSDLTGPVQVSAASGNVTLTNLSGPVTARTASGNLRLQGLSGELRASSASGRLDGTNLLGVREATTTSGDLRLSGTFNGDARIGSSSGDVRIGFAPGSAALITASSASGDIRVQGLTLTDQQQANHSLSGTIGTGEGTVTISTVSGDVTLTNS